MKWINPPVSAFILQSEGNNYESVISTQKTVQKWVPLKSISPTIIFAVIASEDQRFFSHWGIDFKEIKNSINEIREGKRIRGGSTITQQLAKNIFLCKDKNFIRKGFELFYTLLMESVLSKKRILELYLNTAQFGEKLYGIEAASNYYFKKPAQYISISEASELLAILPNPVELDLKNRSKYLDERIERIREEIQKIDLNGIAQELE
jgi:monofunctional biosynthetic peptidoglycan transglycosylase